MIDSQAIEAFNQEVMRPVFPKWDVRGAFAITGGREKRASHISLHNDISNRNNEKSPYCYEGQYQFVHYTSLQNCINIIKEKKIRLYSLQGMDDIEEFSLSTKNVGINLSEYDDKRIKEKIFCFSLSEYHNENDKNNLSLWRSFAEDGNGVSLVFSIDKRKVKDWFNFTLSKVYYNKNDFEKYHEIIERYKAFISKHNLTINNFEALFYRFLSYHKNTIYRDEKEVRLLYTESPESYRNIGIKSIFELNRYKQLRSYIELDLEWKFDDSMIERLKKNNIDPNMGLKPVISIDKILLGYRHTPASRFDLSRVLLQYQNNYKKPIEIEFCGLHEHFNK